MGLLRGHRRSRSAHTDPGNRYYPTFRLLERDGVYDAPTRYEPETLSAQKPPADPYEAWRARREAERERDRARVETVRWVQRQRGTAAAPTAEAAAAEAVRWVHRYRGVGATPAGRDVAPGARVAGRPGERPADLVGAQGG